MCKTIPHQLVFKGAFILGLKLTKHQPSGKEPSRRSRSRNQALELRKQAEAFCSFLKINRPHPSGLVFQQLLAEGVEGAPAAQWAGISVAID